MIDFLVISFKKMRHFVISPTSQITVFKKYFALKINNLWSFILAILDRKSPKNVLFLFWIFLFSPKSLKIVKSTIWKWDFFCRFSNKEYLEDILQYKA